MDKRIINFRMTEEEKKRLKKKAEAKGMTISAYLRYLSTLKVESILTDKQK